MIPWAYVRLMGDDGLTDATKMAIVSANYVARRLRDHYPLCSGDGGLVAHECPLDLRRSPGPPASRSDDVADD